VRVCVCMRVCEKVKEKRIASIFRCVYMVNIVEDFGAQADR
jgi:hypothetical protein